MTTALKKAQATLTGSGTQDTLVTATGQIIIKNIHVVNFSASIITVKMWTGGVANSNMILPPVTMNPGDFGIFDGEIVLEAAGTLKAEANTASACTVTVNYAEIT